MGVYILMNKPGFLYFKYLLTERIVQNEIFLVYTREINLKIKLKYS